MKFVHSWMEESACSVSTFLPNDSKTVFTDGISQGTVTEVKFILYGLVYFHILHRIYNCAVPSSSRSCFCDRRTRVAYVLY